MTKWNQASSNILIDDVSSVAVPTKTLYNQPNPRARQTMNSMFQSGFDFTTKEGTKMILAKSIFPIIGTLFHPSYMMANAVYSDMIKYDPAACAAVDYDKTNEACIKGDSF